MPCINWNDLKLYVTGAFGTLTNWNKIKSDVYQLDKQFTEWLYGPMSEQKLSQLEFLYNTPLKPIIDYKMDMRQDKEYLNRYGMSIEDVHDFRKLHQFGSGSQVYGSALNFVSDNIKRLYR